MKTLIPVILILLGSYSQAQNPNVKIKPVRILDLMPHQLQLRYEDSVQQARQLQTYKGLFGVPILELNVAFQYDNYRLSFGRSYQTETTGNATLEIEKSKTEYLLGIGYQVLHLTSANEKSVMSLFLNAYYGVAQEEVSTKFFGATTKSQNDYDGVSGLGTTVTGRFFKYLITEADFKILNGVNLNPQYVPVIAVRVGGSLYF